MIKGVISLCGPQDMPGRPLVLDSPHSGFVMPPAFTAFVRERLAGFGYEVKVNDPFKGVELVPAYADPAAGRRSLQLEVNKRLYRDGTTLEKTAGFDTLQQHLMQLLDAVHERFHAHLV